MLGIQEKLVRAILLAASGSSGAEGKKYTEARDIVAEKLTPVKLLEAQRMTCEWEKSHPRR